MNGLCKHLLLHSYGAVDDEHPSQRVKPTLSTYDSLIILCDNITREATPLPLRLRVSEEIRENILSALFIRLLHSFNSPAVWCFLSAAQREKDAAQRVTLLLPLLCVTRSKRRTF